MATMQEWADEVFSDLLKRHGIALDLKDALRKSASLMARRAKNKPAKKERVEGAPRKAKSCA